LPQPDHVTDYKSSTPQIAHTKQDFKFFKFPGLCSCIVTCSESFSDYITRVWQKWTTTYSSASGFKLWRNHERPYRRRNDAVKFLIAYPSLPSFLRHQEKLRLLMSACQC